MWDGVDEDALFRGKEERELWPERLVITDSVSAHENG